MSKKAVDGRIKESDLRLTDKQWAQLLVMCTRFKPIELERLEPIRWHLVEGLPAVECYSRDLIPSGDKKLDDKKKNAAATLFYQVLRIVKHRWETAQMLFDLEKEPGHVCMQVPIELVGRVKEEIRALHVPKGGDHRATEK